MNPYRRMIFSALLLVGCASGRVDAAALDPTLPLFTAQSQGDVSLTGGSYQFELGSNTPSLVYLNGPTFTTVATGFIYNGINVFDFHSLDIAAGANISTLQSVSSGPIALLSSTSINMAGSIDVSGGQFTSSPFVFVGGPGAGNAAVGGNGNAIDLGPNGSRFHAVLSGAGGGGFGGFGQQGQSVTYDAGPPTYQSGTVQGGAGGAHYESLADRLQGGSAGGIGAGGAILPLGPGAPGLGGGAIELGAAGTVSVSGSIIANGSNGIDGNGNIPITGGGGGSGGGVFLHANSVDLSGTISALGGSGGAGFGSAQGGAGSGGLVLAQYNNAYGTFSDTGTVNVGSGATVGRFDVQSVPEPSSLILLGMSALGGVVATGLRRRRR